MASSSRVTTRAVNMPRGVKHGAFQRGKSVVSLKKENSPPVTGFPGFATNSTALCHSPGHKAAKAGPKLTKATLPTAQCAPQLAVMVLKR